MPQDTLIPMLISLLAVLLLTLVCGLAGLPWLRRLKVGQTVRDDGPQSHLVKSGTPTFGGLFFLVPLGGLGLAALFSGVIPDRLAALVALMILFGLIGFIDDLIKVRVNKKGLSVRQKTVMMLLASGLFAVWFLFGSGEDAVFIIPFVRQPLAITGWFRVPYAVFTIMVLYFVSNSVNLTDGVDGLASSVTVFASAALGLAGLLLLPGQPSALAGAWLSFALAAGCLGFLAFNRHPARVFMGDTGSQALGAALAGISLLCGVPWLILLAGFVYVAESLSVIIQVAYFKRTGGRRIFRMSPIHHHYELGGWSENKIVLVFTLITILGSAAGLLLLWAGRS